MTNLITLADVEGLGRIVETQDDFYVGLSQLRESGVTPISPREEAYARLQTRGKENIGGSYGTITSAGFEYTKGQLPLLRLESRLLNPELARQAVDANIRGVYFSTPTINEYQGSLWQITNDLSKKRKDRSIIILPSRERFTISQEQNWEIYEAIFKDMAKTYFELNGSIDVIPVNADVVDSQEGTILTQMWFGSLGGGSRLNGNLRDLYNDGRLRGVLKTGGKQ